MTLLKRAREHFTTASRKGLRLACCPSALPAHALEQLVVNLRRHAAMRMSTGDLGVAKSSTRGATASTAGVM